MADVPLPEPDGSVWVGGWVQQGWIGKSMHAHAAAVSAAKDAEIAKLRAELIKSLADNAALRTEVAPKLVPVAFLVRFRTARTAAAMTRDNGGPFTEWGPWCAMMPHEVQMQQSTTMPDCMQTAPLYAAIDAARGKP